MDACQCHQWICIITRGIHRKEKHITLGNGKQNLSMNSTQNNYNLSFSLHSYHHVCDDNFFSSITLFLDLLRKGIYACGTLRQNRKGFPADLKQYTKRGLSERGDFETRQASEKKNLTVAVWQDNKPVTVVATNSHPTKTVTVQRKNKDGTSRDVHCPEATFLYNKYMDGVDRSDQLRSYYHLRLKGRKFYKYIFWFLLDLTITNSYVLCKHHTHLNIQSTKALRADLAKALIGSYSSRKHPGRPLVAPAPKRFQHMEHFPCKGIKIGEKGHRCHNCQVYHDCRKQTVWYCHTCEKFLCHTGRERDCFLEYDQLRV